MMVLRVDSPEGSFLLMECKLWELGYSSPQKYRRELEDVGWSSMRVICSQAQWLDQAFTLYAINVIVDI